MSQGITDLKTYYKDKLNDHAQRAVVSQRNGDFGGFQYHIEMLTKYAIKLKKLKKAV